MPAPSSSSSRAATTACRAFRGICRASCSSPACAPDSPSRIAPMQVLYEEEGELKVGAVLAQAPASLQVESPHGRRSKIKAGNVLLEFERPSGAELLAEAQRFAAGLDADFLWQCCGAQDFGFQDLARDYVGRQPSPGEAAGVLMKLQSAPIYFYRRRPGRRHCRRL